MHDDWCGANRCELINFMLKQLSKSHLPADKEDISVFIYDTDQQFNVEKNLPLSISRLVCKLQVNYSCHIPAHYNNTKSHRIDILLRIQICFLSNEIHTRWKEIVRGKAPLHVLRAKPEGCVEARDTAAHQSYAIKFACFLYCLIKTVNTDIMKHGETRGHM